ncbi:endonuclease/exonuclease/phosphatase family protein [Portibacter marinus]|uniref:endonuclease/exonuclease/phosphatase family protein n=1 Tax=Portibacter marinus TaxID=2898660 RepID=UPI001F3C8AAC|nr:endonuclease/exonuclease/phosphatase family protein [Portibacter marinus]
MRKRKYLQNGIMILLFLVALVPIFNLKVPFLQFSVDFTVQLMLAYLFLGLLFLTIDKRRLLFTSFICCGMLCLFLKQSSYDRLAFPAVTQQEKVTIAHFNTSSAIGGYESVLSAVLASDADIISFQEVTPDWDAFLTENLSTIYPYNVRNVRIDPYGMEIFSKLPIKSYDTFHYQEIPHQLVNIDIADGEQVNIISAHVLPPLGQRLNERARKHLNTIAEKILSIEAPSIVLGDFNLVYWSNEIISFRQKADLENSRRDISKNLLDVPYDHIFFSKRLECTGFGDITDTSSTHLGIIGTYQLKPLAQIRESSIPDFMKN